MLEYTNKSKDNFLFYRGPFSIEMISFMANFVRDMDVSEDIVRKRLFKAFIELTQNVSYYSAELKKKPEDLEPRRGVGTVSVDKVEDKYSVSTCNLIEKVHQPILEKNCNEINDLSETELRELKRETRAQAAIKDIGAHIGLIHTALLTGSKLDINFKSVDDNHSLFTIKVTISL